MEATLREYLNPEKALQNVPTLRMLAESEKSLQRRARELTAIISGKLSDRAEVIFEEGLSQVGGGAMPTADLPTGLVSVRPKHISTEHLVERLRMSEPAVVGRLQSNHLLLDVRTIQESDIKPLLTAFINGITAAGK